MEDQRGKGKSEINIRDEAKKILSSAFRFKDLINAGVKFDPTGHGNSPSDVRIVFSMLKRQTASSAWTVISLGLQVDRQARLWDMVIADCFRWCKMTKID